MAIAFLDVAIVQSECSVSKIDNSERVVAINGDAGGKAHGFNVTCKAGYALSNMGKSPKCSTPGGSFDSIPTCELLSIPTGETSNTGAIAAAVSVTILVLVGGIVGLILFARHSHPDKLLRAKKNLNTAKRQMQVKIGISRKSNRGGTNNGQDSSPTDAKDDYKYLQSSQSTTDSDAYLNARRTTEHELCTFPERDLASNVTSSGAQETSSTPQPITSEYSNCSNITSGELSVEVETGKGVGGLGQVKETNVYENGVI
ncbi:uncharacterized protein LOC135826640 [Sycon ciliatum]|uniref:uncharacterized protein LOC135826640 n=1 Tax=Sycon ciliatum TaxID=27933 RepID=UPI0031F6932A